MRSTCANLAALRRLAVSASAARASHHNHQQHQQVRSQSDYVRVDTQKKISKADVDRAHREKEAISALKGLGYDADADNLDFATRSAVDFGSNDQLAFNAVKRERDAAEAAAAAQPDLTPTRVVFTPDMGAKLLKSKMERESSAMMERSKKREEGLKTAAVEAASRMGGDAATFVAEAEAFASLQSPSTSASADTVIPSEYAEAAINASLEEFAVPDSELAIAQANEVPLEMALKLIYEQRRNDAELVGDAMQSLTRTLYEKRYAGPRLGSDVKLREEFLIPGSASAVLTSSRNDAELLGGEVIVNEALKEGATAVKKLTPSEMLASKNKARMEEEDAEEDLLKYPKGLKPLSAFNAREKRNYAKAVQEMTWIEEWALQEIIIAFNDAESKFDGSPEEYRAQLERVRDTIHESILNKVDQAVNERLAGKPLALILGSMPFVDTEILCEPPVMCPRMETEHWVGWLTYTLSQAATEAATPKPTALETATEAILTNADLLAVALRRSLFNEQGLKYNPDRFKKKIIIPDDPTNSPHNKMDVLDLGCGTGAIGIAIAKAIVGANVVAVDICPEAVQLSRRNAMHNRVPKWKYRAEESDFMSLIVHNALFRANMENAKRVAAAEAAKKKEGAANEGASSSSSSAAQQPATSAVATTASSSSALSTTDLSGSAASDTSGWIPPLDQLHHILEEKELHATMHFLSKACAEKEPLLPVTYDMIVCNPPYVHPDDFKAIVDANKGVEWESELAIVGDPLRRSQQHMYYRDLCVLGHKFSKPVGLRPSWIPKSCPSIAFEVGLQGQVVADLFTQSKLWDNVTLHVDRDKMPRWITAVRNDFDW